MRDWPMVFFIAAVFAAAAPADEESDRLAEIRRITLRIESIERDLERNRRDLRVVEDELAESRQVYELAAAETKEREQELDAARERAERAKREESDLFRALKKRIETDNKAVAAQEELRAAQAALSEARKRVLGPVREKAEYRDAAAALEAARAEAEKLRGEGNGGGVENPSRTDATAAAKKVLALSQAVTALERQALEADPAWVAAEERLTEAKANLLEVNRQITDSIKVDPERAAAVEAIAIAKAEEASASKRLSRTRRELAASKSAYRQADIRRADLQRRIDDGVRAIELLRLRLYDLLSEN